MTKPWSNYFPRWFPSIHRTKPGTVRFAFPSSLFFFSAFLKYESFWTVTRRPNLFPNPQVTWLFGLSFFLKRGADQMTLFLSPDVPLLSCFAFLPFFLTMGCEPVPPSPFVQSPALYRVRFPFLGFFSPFLTSLELPFFAEAPNPAFSFPEPLELTYLPASSP